MPAELFEQNVQVYDALVDWPKRLAAEEPLYREVFARVGARRVLDAACGTGRHAAHFHTWGLNVEGADLSAPMIAHCRRQYGESETLRWCVRGFAEPAGDGCFDAAMCVGNSLALAPDLDAVAAAVGAMVRAVRPSGACILHMLNLWSLPDGPCVWQKCKRTRIDGEEHLLVKGVHRSGGRGFVNLIDVALGAGAATPRYESVPLCGLEAAWLADVARRSGAERIECYGSWQRTPYERERSADLIVVAEK